jgi:hypothetical protein
MADKQSSQTPIQTPAQIGKAEQAARKQARLAQALKANMARRKSQARARNAAPDEDTPTGTAQTAHDKES